jgi:hypothetical protein
MKLSINAPGLSLNDVYYQNRAHGYKTSAKHWIADVCGKLSVHADKFKELREHFDPEKHAYKVALQFYTPRMYTKAGLISLQGLDLSNVEKLLMDVLFTPRYHGNGLYQFENLNIDDKHVVALYSSKQHSTEYRIDITVKIVKR